MLFHRLVSAQSFPRRLQPAALPYGWDPGAAKHTNEWGFSLLCFGEKDYILKSCIYYTRAMGNKCRRSIHRRANWALLTSLYIFSLMDVLGNQVTLVTQTSLSKNHSKSNINSGVKDETPEEPRLSFSLCPHWVFQRKGKEADYTLLSLRKSRYIKNLNVGAAKYLLILTLKIKVGDHDIQKNSAHIRTGLSPWKRTEDLPCAVWHSPGVSLQTQSISEHFGLEELRAKVASWTDDLSTGI